MQNKTVVTKHLNLTFKEDPITECIIPLPECSEILSVENPTDKNIVPIIFVAPTNMFDSHLWSNYHFLIIKCNFSSFDCDDHKYVGTFSMDEDTFAVFWKKGIILSSS